MCKNKTKILIVWLQFIHSFIGLVKHVFSVPGIKEKGIALLSRNMCQDPLENYFGCSHSVAELVTIQRPLILARILRYFELSTQIVVDQNAVTAPRRGGEIAATLDSITPLTRRSGSKNDRKPF